jgi:glutathione S-transferase
MFYHKVEKPLGENAKAAVQKLLHVAQLIIPENGGNLFGEYSIVDSEFAFMIHRLICNGDVVPENVLRYANAQWQRPSVQAFVQIKRKEYVPY